MEEELLSRLRLTVNENLYLKAPDSSELGSKILQHGVVLIDTIGFDDFTFRKLGQVVGTTEASIYRYFENKQKFLLYLSAWYWSWMEYRFVVASSNIASPVKRLQIAIDLITEEPVEAEVAGIDTARLARIIFSESVKSYLNREVDKINREGAYYSYKQFVARLASVVAEINPSYRYPHMLLTTVIEGAHMQRFFAEHLPGLTNIQKQSGYIRRFFSELVFFTLQEK